MQRKTRLHIRFKALTAPWFLLREDHIEMFVKGLQERFNLLAQAAVMPCEECGEPPRLVWNGRILRLCSDCAFRRLNDLVNYDET